MIGGGAKLNLSNIDLLYLTDSEASLQAIHKWIGGGAKLNLSRSPDADVLKSIVLKLQKRVEAGATTLTELCMNGPPPPKNTGVQQFSRLRYEPILCAIILGRKREK